MLPESVPFWFRFGSILVPIPERFEDKTVPEPFIPESYKTGTKTERTKYPSEGAPA